MKWRQQKPQNNACGAFQQINKGCFMIQNLLNQQIMVVHQLYTVALMISCLNYGNDERFNNLLASAYLFQLWELHKHPA